MTDAENLIPEEKESPQDRHEGKGKSLSKETANPIGERADDNQIYLNKDIFVTPNEPLPHLNKGEVKAYNAVGRNLYSENLFALICSRVTTPRMITSVKYGRVVNPSLPKLVASGKIFWPLSGEERYCFIYENILGKPLVAATDGAPSLQWKPDLVLNNIVEPMINALSELSSKDVVHGEIWPANMYYSGNKTGGKIRLGECLSAYASARLPALYEPIDRALATKGMRGTGRFEDDLYSFGVSLAVILRSSDPMKGLNDEQIIEHKIENGSYLSLVGKDRFSGALLELLRGLLYDDRSQRWTLEDVEAWADGRRLTPKQSPKRVKASRPVVLNEQKYTRPELLAKDMHSSPDDANRMIENGDLDQWIGRAIEDKAIKLRMDKVAKDIANNDRSAGFAERLAVIVSTALYPECPIRYKGLSFLPRGFGKALSAAYIGKKDMQPYVDIMKSQFILQVIRNMEGDDASSLVAKFDSSRAFMLQTKMGFGLERCLYFMDPNCHCLSEIVKKHYVQTPEDLINVFEDICNSNTPPQILFDRHIVAFLSVKDKKNIDPYMTDLLAEEPHKRIVGQLKVLASIQQRAKLSDFQNIAKWFSKNLNPVYERIHDRERRALLLKKVDRICDSGDLSKLAHLFDGNELYLTDYYDFKQASNDYKKLENEQEKIEQRLKNRKNYGQRTGRQIASVIAVVLAAVIMLISAYLVLS